MAHQSTGSELAAVEAIIEQCCEPARPQMDDHLVGMYLDPLDQSNKNDPHAQRRHPWPLLGEFAGTGHQTLLEHRLAGVSLEDLEEACRLRQQPADAVGDDLLDLGRREPQPGGSIGPALR